LELLVRNLIQHRPRICGAQDLLNYTEGDEEDVFCLTFTISETHFGDVIQKPLKPDGENIAVTRANKEEFVRLYVDYVLNKSCEASFEAFKKGFLRVVNHQVLQLFHAKVSKYANADRSRPHRYFRKKLLMSHFVE
jgi:hypothetical protein